MIHRLFPILRWAFPDKIFKISTYGWRSTSIKLPAHQPIRERDLLVWKLSWAFSLALFQHQHYLQNYIDKGLGQDLDWRFYKDVHKIEIVKYAQESIECMEYYSPHETFFQLMTSVIRVPKRCPEQWMILWLKRYYRRILCTSIKMEFFISYTWWNKTGIFLQKNENESLDTFSSATVDFNIP